jgi:hypothetical protein
VIHVSFFDHELLHHKGAAPNPSTGERSLASPGSGPKCCEKRI